MNDPEGPAKERCRQCLNPKSKQAHTCSRANHRRHVGEKEQPRKLQEAPPSNRAALLRSYGLDDPETRIIFIQQNPKKENTKSADRYERYKAARTVKEFTELGGRFNRPMFCCPLAAH